MFSSTQGWTDKILVVKGHCDVMYVHSCQRHISETLEGISLHLSESFEIFFIYHSGGSETSKLILAVCNGLKKTANWSFNTFFFFFKLIFFSLVCFLCVVVEAAGGKALACVVDIRDEKQVEEAVQKAVDKFGGEAKRWILSLYIDLSTVKFIS